MSDSERKPPATDRRGAARLAAFIAVPIAVVAGIAFFAIRSATLPQPAASATPSVAASGPVTVTAPPSAPADVVALCGKMIGSLPIVLDGKHSRAVSTAPDRVVAWGDPAVVLRCGVAPVTYPPDANLLGINGVTWYGKAVGRDVVFTSIDRKVPIEITVPAAKGNPSDPIATLSTPIGHIVPPK
ncbi:DUF3515 family protein [Fodinicola acaciae]|uniref:DUF3515 family protein n=1 Tax=Fodinicola acaciae TaxID=2681555 RepID=UPI0013D4797E|nr:DUF3515 family protein [Fodinicola acaciae]